MNISHYFDTSCLLKLYIEENGSVESVACAQAQEALPLSFIGELEFRNALRALQGRGQIDIQEMERALHFFDIDISEGRLVLLRPDIRLIESHSLKISRQYTAQYLCRALDILHIATALVAKIPCFVTCDKRQAQLAEKVGLNVTYIDLKNTQ